MTRGRQIHSFTLFHLSVSEVNEAREFASFYSKVIAIQILASPFHQIWRFLNRYLYRFLVFFFPNASGIQATGLGSSEFKPAKAYNKDEPVWLY